MSDGDLKCVRCGAAVTGPSPVCQHCWETAYPGLEYQRPAEAQS